LDYCSERWLSSKRPGYQHSLQRLNYSKCEAVSVTHGDRVSSGEVPISKTTVTGPSSESIYSTIIGPIHQSDLRQEISFDKNKLGSKQSAREDSFPVRVGKDSMLSLDSSKAALKSGPRYTNSRLVPQSSVDFFESKYCPNSLRVDRRTDFQLGAGHNCYQKGLNNFADNKSSKILSWSRDERICLLEVDSGVNITETMHTVPSIDNIFNVEMPSTSMPGGDWNNLAKNKMEIAGPAAMASAKIFNDIKSGLKPNFSLITRLAGKEKAFRQKVDCELVSSRPLEQEDAVACILGKAVIGQFETQLKHLKFSPIKIGTSPTKRGFEETLIDTNFYKYGLEADASSHDAHVTASEIFGGLAVARLFYEESEWLDELFYTIGSMICCRTMITEDRFCINTIASMMTGSFSTCWLNSVITLYRVRRVRKDHKILSKLHTFGCLILGDDVLMLSQTQFFIKKDELSSFVWKNYGFDWKIERTGYNVQINPEYSTEFLKHVKYWDKAGVARITVKPSTLSKRLGCPSYTHVKNEADYCRFLIANRVANMSHYKSRKVWAGLLTYSYWRLGKIPKSQISFWIKTLAKDVKATNNILFSNSFMEIVGEMGSVDLSPKKERFTVFQSLNYFPNQRDISICWLWDNYDRKILRSHNLKPNIDQLNFWFRVQMGSRPNLAICAKKALLTDRSILVKNPIVVTILIDLIKSLLDYEAREFDLGFSKRKLRKLYNFLRKLKPPKKKKKKKNIDPFNFLFS
jgi:hypothetical protein